MKKSLNFSIFILIILFSTLFGIGFVGATYTENDLLGITGLKYSSMSITDFDHDTNLEVLMCGQSGGNEENAQTILYEIVDGNFIKQDLDISNVTYCSVNWIDVDGDSFDDVVISGEDINNNIIMEVYRNDGIYNDTSFSLYQTATSSLIPKSMSDSVVGDLNNDGNLDLVVIGCNESIAGKRDGVDNGDYKTCNSFSSDVYLNNGSYLVYNQTWSDSLENIWQGSLALGDYNNDGRLDLVMSGSNESIASNNSAVTYIYNNTGNGFAKNNIINVEGVWWGSLALEDYDSDGDLDLFISGLNESKYAVTKIYESDQSLYSGSVNVDVPTITSFTYDEINSRLNIDFTNPNSQYYNIKLGSSEGSNDIISGLFSRSSNPTNGYFGNLMKKNSISYSIHDRCIYGQVQEIGVNMNESSWSVFVNHNSTEVCDGYDNDCDSLVDGIVGVTKIDENWDKDGDGFVGNDYYNSVSDLGIYSTCSILENDSLYNLGFDCDDNDANAYPGSSYTKCGKNYDCSSKDVYESCTAGGGSGGGTRSVKERIVDVKEVDESYVEDNIDIIDIPKIIPETQKKPTIEEPKIVKSLQELAEEKVIDDLLNLGLKIKFNSKPIYDGQGNTIIQFKTKNNNLFDQNVYITNTIPKSVALNIDEMDYIKGHEYDVLEYDPVIGFAFKLPSHKEHVVKYKVNKILSVEDIQNIVAEVIADDKQQDELQAKLKKAITETKDVINLSQSYQVNLDKNQTIFTIDIDIDKEAGLTNVSIFQEIPKCLLEIINEQIVESKNRKFEVINDDPLIAWHFDKLIDAEQIQYTINAIADDNCTNQVKALAVAREIDMHMRGNDINYKNVFLAVSIIPILALIMIIFGLVSAKIEHEDEEVQKLVKYIRKHYRNGFNKEQLRNKLVSAGYEEKIINECLQLHTKNKFHYWVQRLEIGFNELMLVVLIILNILDFLEILPGDIDYLKKIISWVMLAYLLYNGSITKILFGTKNKLFDVSLIFIFFSLTIKNLVGFARVAVGEVERVADLYAFLVYHNVIFEQYLFVAGLIALLIISFILAMKLPIKSPSFASAIHMKEGVVSGIDILKRTLMIHFVLIGFFIVVFNLMMEWLAIAVDALILVITLIVMVGLIIKHHKKFTAGKFMEETSGTAEQFYEKFIDLFHYKKTIYLGFSGMLILHALTEVGSFIVPYLLGIRDSIYFGNSGFLVDHNPLFFSALEHIEPLFKTQISGLSEVLKYQVGYIYVMNSVAILTLFILSALVWGNYFKHKNLPILEVPRLSFGKNKLIEAIITGFLTSSFVVFFSRPVFILKSFLGGDDLVGVDILTKMISLDNIGFVIMLSVIIGIIVAIFVLFKEDIAHYTLLPVSYIFFSIYIYKFGESVFYFNMTQISILLKINQFMAFYVLVFALISVIGLYIMGFVINTYLYAPHWFKEIMREIPVVKLLFVKHDHHHIHHYDHHDNAKHMEKEEAIKDYILKSLDSGHELFYAVEHLVEHGWPVPMIEEAISLVKHDKLFKEDIHHISHYHHNKKRIHELADWIKKSYEKYGLDSIIDTAEKQGWSDDDLILAIKVLKHSMKFKKKDQEILRYMKVMK